MSTRHVPAYPQVLPLQSRDIQYHPQEIDTTHPAVQQQPLCVQPQPGVNEVLARDPEGKQWGFVGYAANLVHFPQVSSTPPQPPPAGE